MKTYLETMQENIHQLHDCKIDLLNLSSALYRVGNNKLGNELFQIATDVENIEKSINTTVHDKLNHDYKTSNDIHNGLITLALNCKLDK